ncbi:MAG: NTP/NDP exchange transporter [Woeseiaceae bacterium]
MAAASIDKLRTYLFDTVLGLERHEYVAVAWSFAYFFCVLSSYYILRPVREAMAVESGPETIPYLFVGTFVAMLFATSVFGWVASRFPRRLFLPWVYVFFASNIAIFWVLFTRAIDAGDGYVWLGRAYFVWLGVFNLFVVSVFWSFMADIYTREQGRRLFGIISAGGSIGALIGGAGTSAVVVSIGFHNLLPVAGLLLLLSVLCIRKLRFWVVSEHADEITETAASDKPLGGSAFAGITHLLASKYFGGIAVSSLIASTLGAALYMFAAELVALEIPDVDQQTRFFSNLNIAANSLSLVAQAFIVKHVVKRFGVGRALVLLPFVSVIGFAMLAMDPVLAVVAMLTVARRAIGFGFTKPSTDMLYSVVTPEEKYKTKNFIDTAIYRGGDVVGTWFIKFMAALGISGISLVMLPISVFWAIVSLWLGRDYRRRARELKQSGIS